jgi:hypothetical protein
MRSRILNFTSIFTVLSTFFLAGCFSPSNVSFSQSVSKIFSSSQGTNSTAPISTSTSAPTPTPSSTTTNTVSTPSPSPTPTPTPTSTTVNSGTLPAPIAGQNYVMTFDDEFTSLNTISNSNTFNGSKWYNGVDQCCMGDSTGLPGVMFPTVYNGLSVNPYGLITGGGLNLTLSKVNSTWYSGILTSVDSSGTGFSQKYGYFEFRAKLPAGPSTWPSFWLLNTANLAAPGTQGTGEIDVFEQFGQFPNNFCTTLHDWTGGTTPYYNCNISVANMETDYHTWGMLWTQTAMTIYFDNVQVLTTTTPSVMQQAYYMLIDLGVGGGWPTDQTPSTNSMQVQYVRVYAPQ